MFLQCTFIDDAKTVEEANAYGHIHLKEVSVYIPNIGHQLVLGY